MAIFNDSLRIVLFVFAILAGSFDIVSIILKLCKDFSNPKLWKYSLLYQDVAHSCLAVGLVLFSTNLHADISTVCDAAGFFLSFGLLLCLLSYFTTGIIVLSIQNPGKSSSISNFHRNVFIVIVLPQIVIGGALSLLPYLLDINNSDITCFPIGDIGGHGASYGTLIVVIWWIIIVTCIVCDVIIILKLWKFNNRINSAHNNVWQAQLLAQGKILVKVCVLEHVIIILTTFSTSLAIYLDVVPIRYNEAEIVVTSFTILAVLHAVISNICDVMWTSCCCRDNSQVKEPHRKLKKLELLSIETSGKLRMKATWTIGKHATKRGLMKVYGEKHLKSWAQEIVMLGMMRRIQHPSLIQCLWTNSSNPYYETMTLISGEIITSDSRIICLELTNGGTLREFLQKIELPLPEQCQRMIVHDIAEGLFYLHHENIVHSNLNSSCIYLKGSLQSMVLRAAVGDFEEAQIYGTLQQSFDNSIKDKRYFFLPDIRSFGLIALEVLTKMSEKKFQNRYVNYSSENVPLKLNLTGVISDEDDEFEPQFPYSAEDTHRMFQAVHDNGAFSDGESDDDFHVRETEDGSLVNLKSPRRPMSPAYNGRDLQTPDTIFDSSESADEFTKDDTPIQAAKPKHKSHKQKPNSLNPPESNERSRKKNTIVNCKAKKENHVTMSKTSCFEPKGSQQINNSKLPDNGRCVSPDPMQDEKLQELRNETKSGVKLSKKERKLSFSKKKIEQLEGVPQKGKVEAFVKSGTGENVKRKDGNWLNKPTSILKSITGNDTNVSVFKAKPNDEESHLDAIEEEDIYPNQKTVPRQVKVKEAKPNKAEVWDIIDEQYYSQVNKKAMNKLKKTVSGESKSSLWSFISTPEDLDDDDLDDLLSCLPGMADPVDYRKPEITVNDIVEERENAHKRESLKKRFSMADLPNSRFELIDYYELLKAKQITMNDVPEDKREMLLNVVELKREEKRKKDIIRGNIIMSDEMYDNNMCPGNANNNSKGKLVSFRKEQCHSSPQKSSFPEPHDPRLDRARSAPLKRPRTPMHKPHVDRTPEVNPVFSDTKSVTIAKRNRARAALKRALNNKNRATIQQPNSDRGRPAELTVKYATVRKVASLNDGDSEQDMGELITVPVPTSESFSVPNPKTVTKSVKRYPSFSSNESSSTLMSSERHHGGINSSLTSGEVSSLSSQAESDHYETDYHMTDTESGHRFDSNGRNMVQKPSSRVDSGFDSGSMSSEMSDAFTTRKLQLNSQFQYGNNKGVVDSWARNYTVIDSKSDNIASNFDTNGLPPVGSLPENHFGGVNDTSVQNKDIETFHNGSHNSRGRNIRNRKRAVAHRQKEALNISPYASVSSRPDPGYSRSLSPPSRVVSPIGRQSTPSRTVSPESSIQGLQRKVKAIESNDTSKSMSPKYPHSSKSKPSITQSMSALGRPLSPQSRSMSPLGRPLSPQSRSMSPSGRPMSPKNRPMSPLSRPMSPNVQPVDNRAIKKQHSFSNKSRVMSPSPGHVRDSEAFSPGRKLNRPLSPIVDKTQNLETVSNADSTTSKASKRYRELIKKGVPLRTSVIDASPTRGDETTKCEVQIRPSTAESMKGDDEELFKNLEANGFFEAKNRSRSPSPNKLNNNSRNRSPKYNKNGEPRTDTRRRKKKQIPLEELVRESPDTRKSRAHRSASENHLAVTEDAILNQPTSEDSETCSIKTNKSNSSTPSGSKPKLMIDAELVIDRIFSQNQPENNELDVEVEAALGLDKDPFKVVKEMYLKEGQSETPNLNEIPLLNGINEKHIHECIELASSLHVLTVRDLLPATQESFSCLRSKLHQIGQLGTVGHQLLDVIQKCWLLDMPPSSSDLVEQLTDPVTETEL